MTAAAAMTHSLDKLGLAVGLFAHKQVRRREATGLGFTRGPAPVVRLFRHARSEIMMKRHVQYLAAAGLFAAGLVSPATAQDTIKIGELNSYKAQPAFLDPYKKGWEMAIEEINAKGGVLGKKLEVISRDDGANPGEAVRVAEELITREGVAMIARTFLSHIGLAVTNFAGQKKVFFLAAEPLTDKITWQNGNKYTYRLRATTYMQTAMLMTAAIAAK